MFTNSSNLLKLYFHAYKIIPTQAPTLSLNNFNNILGIKYFTGIYYNQYLDGVPNEVQLKIMTIC